MGTWPSSYWSRSPLSCHSLAYSSVLWHFLCSAFYYFTFCFCPSTFLNWVHYVTMLLSALALISVSLKGQGRKKDGTTIHVLIGWSQAGQRRKAMYLLSCKLFSYTCCWKSVHCLGEGLGSVPALDKIIDLPFHCIWTKKVLGFRIAEAAWRERKKQR